MFVPCICYFVLGVRGSTSGLSWTSSSGIHFLVLERGMSHEYHQQKRSFNIRFCSIQLLLSSFEVLSIFFFNSNFYSWAQRNLIAKSLPRTGKQAVHSRFPYYCDSSLTSASELESFRLREVSRAKPERTTVPPEQS